MHRFWQLVKRYIAMFRHWALMLSGASYWHGTQGLGRAYTPSDLQGYHNDLSGKTHWDGPVDSEGVPLCRMAGASVYFPTMVFQKALGHWDRWLITRDTVHKTEFLHLAHWALKHLDEKGGWKIWSVIGMDASKPYSGMTQGEGISVMVRAHKITGEERYLQAATAALAPMFTAITEGGTQRAGDHGPIIEEFPTDDHSGVLNGWIFAIFGLHDYLLVRRDAPVRVLLQETLSALVRSLHDYDAGFWSRYDLRGAIASPFYHGLHIAQLKALELTFPEAAANIAWYRQRFEDYEQSTSKRLRAMAMKAAQKLANPPATVLR